MASVQHVHLKTRDPKQTAQFYVDNFGATMKAEIPGRGFRLDLHGLQLNITGLIASQNHEQHYGIEHIAVDTEDYDGTLARMRKNGVRDSRRDAAQQWPPGLLCRSARRRPDGIDRKGLNLNFLRDARAVRSRRAWPER